MSDVQVLNQQEPQNDAALDRQTGDHFLDHLGCQRRCLEGLCHGAPVILKIEISGSVDLSLCVVVFTGPPYALPAGCRCCSS
jgi:hypothetical protein